MLCAVLKISNRWLLYVSTYVHHCTGYLRLWPDDIAPPPLKFFLDPPLQWSGWPCQTINLVRCLLSPVGQNGHKAALVAAMLHSPMFFSMEPQ